MQAYDGEARKPSFADTGARRIEGRLIPASARIFPDDVELGYHFCYGGSAASGSSSRRTWAPWSAWPTPCRAGCRARCGCIHMPVPIERSDDAYFAPLADLRLHAGLQRCISA